MFSCLGLDSIDLIEKTTKYKQSDHSGKDRENVKDVLRLKNNQDSALLEYNKALFSDVPQRHWANSVIDKGVNGGLVAGYPDGKFKPNNLVTRTEALVQQGMDSIAAISASDAPWIREIAAQCSKSFSRKALEVFSKASMLIDRNVSQKMVFANVVDRLYMSI